MVIRKISAPAVARPPQLTTARCRGLPANDVPCQRLLSLMNGALTERPTSSARVGGRQSRTAKASLRHETYVLLAPLAGRRECREPSATAFLALTAARAAAAEVVRAGMRGVGTAMAVEGVATRGPGERPLWFFGATGQDFGAAEDNNAVSPMNVEPAGARSRQEAAPHDG